MKPPTSDQYHKNPENMRYLRGNHQSIGCSSNNFM